MLLPGHPGGVNWYEQHVWTDVDLFDLGQQADLYTKSILVLRKCWKLQNYDIALIQDLPHPCWFVPYTWLQEDFTINVSTLYYSHVLNNKIIKIQGCKLVIKLLKLMQIGGGGFTKCWILRIRGVWELVIEWIERYCLLKYIVFFLISIDINRKIINNISSITNNFFYLTYAQTVFQEGKTFID